MRKLFTILCLLVFSISIHAQCAFDSIAISPGTGYILFFTPSSDSLPCIPTGWPSFTYDTLYFTTFSVISGFNVDSMTIDSINNLPPTMCWCTNVANNTFAANQNGVLLLYGAGAAYPGQYKLQIYAHFLTDFFTIGSATLERLVGLRYYLRVSCPSYACPPLDTAGGADSLYIPYTQTCAAGISTISGEVTDIAISPNPFYHDAVVTFDAPSYGSCTISLTDLVGKVVSTKEIIATAGTNQTTIDRNGISAGLYLLSVTNGNVTRTKKVVIE